ncbi:hypothetical protein HK101_008741 [Irineochytrium annulatum]|nr:hypothetical protein HK101_008741 [Irineochytrium annulatum]
MVSWFSSIGRSAAKGAGASGAAPKAALPTPPSQPPATLHRRAASASNADDHRQVQLDNLRKLLPKLEVHVRPTQLDLVDGADAGASVSTLALTPSITSNSINPGKPVKPTLAGHVRFFASAAPPVACISVRLIGTVSLDLFQLDDPDKIREVWKGERPDAHPAVASHVFYESEPLVLWPVTNDGRPLPSKTHSVPLTSQLPFEIEFPTEHAHATIDIANAGSISWRVEACLSLQLPRKGRLLSPPSSATLATAASSTTVISPLDGSRSMDGMRSLTRPSMEDIVAGHSGGVSTTATKAICIRKVALSPNPERTLMVASSEGGEVSCEVVAAECVIVGPGLKNLDVEVKLFPGDGLGIVRAVSCVLVSKKEFNLSACPPLTILNADSVPITLSNLVHNALRRYHREFSRSYIDAKVKWIDIDRSQRMLKGKLNFVVPIKASLPPTVDAQHAQVRHYIRIIVEHSPPEVEPLDETDEDDGLYEDVNGVPSLPRAERILLSAVLMDKNNALATYVSARGEVKYKSSDFRSKATTFKMLSAQQPQSSTPHQAEAAATNPKKPITGWCTGDPKASWGGWCVGDPHPSTPVAPSSVEHWSAAPSSFVASSKSPRMQYKEMEPSRPLEVDGLEHVAKVARGLIMDAAKEAGSGHLGLPLGCAELGAVLWGHFMNFYPDEPKWLNRDSLLQYTYLHLAGYNVSLDDLKNYRKLYSRTPGHPEYGLTDGIEATTGPLGQGLANAVGMAMANKKMEADFNTEDFNIVDGASVICVAGDGCIQEGINHEACALAAHWGLDNLIVIYDANQVTMDNPADKSQSENAAGRFRSYGWDVLTCDTPTVASIASHLSTLKARRSDGRPKLLVLHTVIGHGIPEVEGTRDAHAAGGIKHLESARANLGINGTPFYVSDRAKALFDARKAELKKGYDAWFAKYESWRAEHVELARILEGSSGKDMAGNVFRLIEGLEPFEEGKAIATRKAGARVLQHMAERMPLLLTGAADVHVSTLNWIKGSEAFSREDRSGRNMCFGKAFSELTMIAYHGVYRPSCATFLVFSEYLRPALRLAAIAKLPVVFIFTHDSVAIGGDGPTHQPVEVLSSLRTVPNLDVQRPADGEETAGAFAAALERLDGPTAIILSRQDLPDLASTPFHERRESAARGAYVVRRESAPLRLILLSSGSELSVALRAADTLGPSVRVVSVPSIWRFHNQSQSYIDSILPPSCAARVAVEANVGSEWWRLVGGGAGKGRVVGIDRFGYSGGGTEVLEAVGMTVDRVVEVAKDVLGGGEDCYDDTTDEEEDTDMEGNSGEEGKQGVWEVLAGVGVKMKGVMEPLGAKAKGLMQAAAREVQATAREVVGLEPEGEKEKKGEPAEPLDEMLEELKHEFKHEPRQVGQESKTEQTREHEPHVELAHTGVVEKVKGVMEPLGAKAKGLMEAAAREVHATAREVMGYESEGEEEWKEPVEPLDEMLEKLKHELKYEPTRGEQELKMEQMQKPEVQEGSESVPLDEMMQKLKHELKPTQQESKIEQNREKERQVHPVPQGVVEKMKGVMEPLGAKAKGLMEAAAREVQATAREVMGHESEGEEEWREPVEPLDEMLQKLKHELKHEPAREEKELKIEQNRGKERQVEPAHTGVVEKVKGVMEPLGAKAKGLMEAAAREINATAREVMGFDSEGEGEKREPVAPLDELLEKVKHGLKREAPLGEQELKMEQVYEPAVQREQPVLNEVKTETHHEHLKLA